MTDAFPLPIEGFETRVIADDDKVINYMINLGETLETTRKVIALFVCMCGSTGPLMFCA